MRVRGTEFPVMPFTLFSVLLIPLAVLLADLAGMTLPCLANASAWTAMVVLVMAWAYGCGRRLAYIPVICELALIFTTVTIAVLIYSYVTLRANHPLADAALYATDRSLGFDVRAIVTWVDGSPVLSWLMEKSYRSLGLQPALIPIAIALLHSTERAARTLAGLLTICVVGCTISIGWPAVGSFKYLDITAHDLQNLNAAVGYHFLEGFYAARRDEVFSLTVDLLSGVSTFPSIHAALAVLFTWALWPVRALRYPCLALNGLMYVSTIPVGAHYVVDVAAGTVLAVAAIWACAKAPAQWWEPRVLWQPAPAPSGGMQVAAASDQTSLASSAR